MNVKLMSVLVVAGLLSTGCTLAPYNQEAKMYDKDRERVELADLPNRAQEYKVGAEAVHGVMTELNGCGRGADALQREVLQAPTIVKGSKVQDENGKLDYNMVSSGNGVDKCVE